MPMKKIIFSLRLIGLLSLLVGATCSSNTVGPDKGLPSSPVIGSSPSTLGQSPNQGRKADEQRLFGAEETIIRPVDIPADVLDILQRDERNRTCLAPSAPSKGIDSSWFLASRIELNNDSSPDLVIVPSNPCLFGANIIPFWMFRNTPQGHKLILNVSGLGLEVLNERTNGYHDVRVDSPTAREVLTTVFKFNGDRYRAGRFSRNPI
jgi:hypothetical protein